MSCNSNKTHMNRTKLLKYTNSTLQTKFFWSQFCAMTSSFLPIFCTYMRINCWLHFVQALKRILLRHGQPEQTHVLLKIITYAYLGVFVRIFYHKSLCGDRVSRIKSCMTSPSLASCLKWYHNCRKRSTCFSVDAAKRRSKNTDCFLNIFCVKYTRRKILML